MTTKTKTPDRATLMRQARKRAEAEMAVAETAGRLAEARAHVAGAVDALDTARERRARVLESVAERGSLTGDSPAVAAARQAVHDAEGLLEDARALEAVAAERAASASAALEAAPDVNVSAVVGGQRARALEAAQRATAARQELVAASLELLAALDEAGPLSGLPGMVAASRRRGEGWLDRWLHGTAWMVRPRWAADVHPAFRDTDISDWLARAWPAPVETDEGEE